MKLSRSIIFAAIAALAPLAIQATPVAITTNPTLSVGGLTFDNFTCSLTNGGATSTPNACSQINVGTITSPALGLQITSGFLAGPGSFTDAGIGYRVTSSTGISQIGLDFNGFFVGEAITSVTENVYSGATLVGFANVINSSPTLGGTTMLSTTIALSGTFTDLTVVKDIHLTGTTGVASASVVNQTFAVPEPSSTALLGLGLVGFAASFRRRLKK